RSPCPLALHRAHHGSDTRSSRAPREPCTARGFASRLPSTVELFGRNTPVSWGWLRIFRGAPPPVSDVADGSLPALVMRHDANARRVKLKSNSVGHAGLMSASKWRVPPRWRLLPRGRVPPKVRTGARRH